MMLKEYILRTLKKVIQWFNLLVNSGMDFSKIEATKEETEKE